MWTGHTSTKTAPSGFFLSSGEEEGGPAHTNPPRGGGTPPGPGVTGYPKMGVKRGLGAVEEAEEEAASPGHLQGAGGRDSQRKETGGGGSLE